MKLTFVYSDGYNKVGLMNWKAKGTVATVDIVAEFDKAVSHNVMVGKLKEDEYQELFDNETHGYSLIHALSALRASDYPAILEWEEVEPVPGETYKRSKVTRVHNGSFGWLPVL